MAEHLADIYGTEKDKVNCPFYWKIGACRHGDRCSRQHNRPPYSPTLLIKNMYPNPQALPMLDEEGNPVQPSEDQIQEHFEDFYEDVFEELSEIGEIEELNVADNVAEHLLGNTYVKFFSEDEAQKAMTNLSGRYYAGRPILPEFCPVTDFGEARCRQYETGECTRGGFCNFLHLKRPARSLKHDLFKEQRKRYRKLRGRSRSRSRSKERDRHRRHRRHRSHRSHRSRRSSSRSPSRSRHHRSRRHRERRSRDDRKRHRSRSADESEPEHKRHRESEYQSETNRPESYGAGEHPPTDIKQEEHFDGSSENDNQHTQGHNNHTETNSETTTNDPNLVKKEEESTE